MRGLCGFLLLSLAAAGASAGMIVTALHGWFRTLRQPALLPHPVFPMVWGAAFLLAGLAAWVLWRRPDMTRRAPPALTAWGWMLGATALLPAVFFGLHSLWAALVLNAAALAAAAVTLRRFFQLNRGAALILLPFIGWTGFTAWVIAGFCWCNH